MKLTMVVWEECRRKIAVVIRTYDVGSSIASRSLNHVIGSELLDRLHHHNWSNTERIVPHGLLQCLLKHFNSLSIPRFQIKSKSPGLSIEPRSIIPITHLNRLPIASSPLIELHGPSKPRSNNIETPLSQILPGTNPSAEAERRVILQIRELCEWLLICRKLRRQPSGRIEGLWIWIKYLVSMNRP